MYTYISHISDSLDGLLEGDGSISMTSLHFGAELVHLLLQQTSMSVRLHILAVAKCVHGMVKGRHTYCTI